MVIIIAILAFGVLIAVHELGHFFAAKAFGVKVEEFALGMGPTIFKKQGKETLYSLRLLPLGGFCAMEGEDEQVDSPRAFTSQKAWKRAIILCAGAFMNFVLGFIIVACLVPASKSFTEPIVVSFMEGCPFAGEDKMLEGDRIYSVDGCRTYFVSDFNHYTPLSGSDYHDVVVVRDGKKVHLDDLYMPLKEYTLSNGSTGLKYGINLAPREYGFGVTLKYAWFESMNLCRIVWESLGMLVSGNVGLRDMSGVIGVVDVVNDVAHEAPNASAAAYSVSYIFALIAINLAIMNLLPIPALDGGRVFFLIVTAIIEAITRRKLNPKYEGYIHSAGFFLLMALMIFLMFSDVLKAFFGI